MNKIEISASDFKEINTSSTIIVEIANLCFEVDERYPWINLYIITDGEKKFLMEIEEEDMPVIVEHKELKEYALKWFIKNVELV